MILTPEVLAIVILNTLFIFFTIIASLISLRIFLKWDIDATTKLQYTLEKQSFLTATIIKYIFIIKIPLFLFFIFTLDKISFILPGAMCGAGVVDATPYGNPLFVLKILNLYLFSYWLFLHNEDIKYENQPYTKLKFALFNVASLFFITELIVEIVMFNAIDATKIVDCCGTIYSSSATSYISVLFHIGNPTLLTLFYGNFLLMVIFYLLKKSYLFAMSNIFFIISSIISLIVFFGTYIYEQPSHHCPFCFLQSDYYYVGYLLYSVLFIGTVYGIVSGFIPSEEKIKDKRYKISLFFNSFYLLIVTFYPVSFYLLNKVWL